MAIGEVLRYHHKSVSIEGTNYTSAMFTGMPQSHSGSCAPLDNTGNGNLSHLLRDIGIAVGAKDLKAITACTERLSALEKAKAGKKSSSIHLVFVFLCI